MISDKIMKQAEEILDSLSSLSWPERIEAIANGLHEQKIDTLKDCIKIATTVRLSCYDFSEKNGANLVEQAIQKRINK